MTWMPRMAKRAFLSQAETIRFGSLELVCPDRTYCFSGRDAGAAGLMAIHDERTFTRAMLAGDRGLGEAFMDGHWSSPDLVSLLRMALRNRHAFNRLNGAWSWLARQVAALRHRRRANTRAGSRDNISAHYDLGNDFFSLFLDRDLMYSSAWYEHEHDTLETAQRAKVDRICRRLRLSPADHLLEIGTGWGAFAEHAATVYGCRVTTTTISREQYRYSADRFARLGAAGARITLLQTDYRDLVGQFDKIASIEMFEAVGLAHYDEFFARCDRLLGPCGAVLLQTITMNEQDFHTTYRDLSDWMQTHVFPGSELACLSEMLRSIGRVTGLRPFHLEDLGRHYALTLRTWRARFQTRVLDARGLGLDERFIRMWDLYLAFCEAAFAERHISDVQLLLTRGYHDLPYDGDPGQPTTAGLAYEPRRARREASARESA
jgi:cyclopropane-fatty-acyl-phospholipid synthase